MELSQQSQCIAISARSRMKMLFCPIRRWETVRKECGDAETHFEIYPEAFRMIAHVYFWFFFGTAAIVTYVWSDVDFNDNIIIDTFGQNNICITVDDPPFSYFGSTLYFPATTLMLLFQFFDYIRVHDHYRDGDDRYPISTPFFVYYTISSAVETFFVISFPQVI